MKPGFAKSSVILLGLVGLVCLPLAAQSSEWLFESAESLDAWLLEADTTAAKPTLWYVQDGAMHLKTEKGATVWLRKPLQGNVRIHFRSAILQDGCPYDRLSDMNCFWMASDPQHPADLFARSAHRNGEFPRYYELDMYYLGYGGNRNTTTRFRRYHASAEAVTDPARRPAILTEYTDSAHLLLPNHWYENVIEVNNGRVRYFVDGELLVDYEDPEPLRGGHFGLRTTWAHAAWKDIRVEPIRVNRRYIEPADTDYPGVHDPVVARCDGRYYLFSTGYGISVWSSADAHTWHREKPALDPIPQWAMDAVPGYRGHTWAPDISYRNGKYYLYYSCSTFGKNNSCIGVATNRTLDPSSPDFKWEDQGMVVRSIPGRDQWNAIDPNVFEDEDGTLWMVFGSFWQGIKLVQLDADGCRLAQPEKWYSLCQRPRLVNLPDTPLQQRRTAVEPGNGAVEAPFLFRRDGWYYLFCSYDLCCRGSESTYKVVVGRSKDLTGPYFDRDGVSLLQDGGTVVVAGNDRYPGVGHSATVSFDGVDYLYFHGYDMHHNGQSRLLVRSIHWSDDGWPSVEL